MKRYFLALVLILTSCASQYKQTYRGVASEDQAALPPMAQIHPTWIYTWSNRYTDSKPETVRNFIKTGVDHAQSCLVKLTPEAEYPVSGCEGDGMAAGPGIYTCDNPFISHDYGDTVYAMKVTDPEKKAKVNLATGTFTPGQADGFAREIYSGKDISGVMYDFRYTDANGRAMTVRNENLFDLNNADSFYVVTLKNRSWKKFNAHESFVCNEKSSISEMLTNWGDQLDFMAQVYVSINDPDGENFITKGELSDSAILAAVASDFVSKPDADFKKALASVVKLEDHEWVFSCIDTSSVSARACATKRIISSLSEDQGTVKHPSYAWDFTTTKKVLAALDPTKAKTFTASKSIKDLKSTLIKTYRADKNAMARIKESFDCAMIAKKQNETNNFANWGKDPE